LAAGYRILNYDESSLSFSNFNNYSWSRKGSDLMKDEKTIKPRISLVAAVDSNGN
jgi:hypothetical protein